MNEQQRSKWLIHLNHDPESQAYKIAEMLLDGSSMKSMVDEMMKEKYRKRSKQAGESRDEDKIEKRIKNHIRYLENKHMMKVINDKGILKIIYRYDLHGEHKSV